MRCNGLGLIFTFENDPYLAPDSQTLQLLKWKYLPKNTVDFLVCEADDEETKTLGHANRAFTPRAPLCRPRAAACCYCCTAARR